MKVKIHHGRAGSPALPNLSAKIGGHGFDSRRTHKFFPKTTNGGVPHGSPRLGHVAPCYSPKIYHVSEHDFPTFLPSQHAIVPTMSLYGRMTYKVSCHIIIVWTVQTS
jgi:hypothetical protein